MRTYRHIIWDWNGTLLDDVQASVNALNQLLAQRALPPTDVPTYRRDFGFPVRNYYPTIGIHPEKEDWDRLARIYHDLYLADPSIRLHDHALAALQSCADAGLTQSVLSAAEQALLERMLADAGVTRWFDFIHGADNLHGHSKVETGRHLVRRLPGPASQVLLVGDTLHDHEVAAALGCDCVLVSQGHQTHARLLAAGCPVLESLSMLPPFLNVES